VEIQAGFKRVEDNLTRTLPLLEYIVAQTPKTHNLDDWEGFARKAIKLDGSSEFIKKHDQIKALLNDTKNIKWESTGAFESSGWNAASFKAGIAAYFALTEKAKATFLAADKIISSLGLLIEETGAEDETVSETSDTTKKAEGDEAPVATSKTVTKTKRKDNVLALKAMNTAFDAVWDAYFSYINAKDHMHTALRHVSNHFDHSNG
jgi:hypothetical protein